MSIHLNFDTGNLSSEEADGLSALLGAVRPSLPNAKELAKRYDAPGGLYGSTAILANTPMNAPPSTVSPESADVSDASEPTTDNAPKRERGQPSPGKARRTKAEIAEDEAADLRNATATHMTPDNGDPVVARNAETDSPEDAAQDAADEQAEVDAERDDGHPVTVDDLKAAYLPYVDKFGLEATKEDGAKLFASIFGPPPAGANGWTTAAMLEQGQDKARAVIAGWAAAAAAETRFGA